MNDTRHAARFTTSPVEDDAVGSDQPILGGPSKRRSQAAPRHRLRRSVHLALTLMLTLSLMPLLLVTETARATDPSSSKLAPSAKAVRLLERLRDSNAQPQAQQQLTQQAKPGQQDKQGKKAKQGKKGKPGKAKKHPKVKRINRKGCIFEVRKRTWTLVRKCAPNGTIVVPNGITLNGRNRVMVVTGNISKFDGAVVAAGFGQANVRNLRLEGNAGLTGQCLGVSAGLLFYHASGTISNVTVRNIEPAPSGCSNSIGVHVYGQKRVNILNSTVHNAGRNGLAVIETVNSTIAGNSIVIESRAVAGSANGMLVADTTNAVVRNNDFQRAGDDETLGISASENTGLVISGNRFHELVGGIRVGTIGEPASALITDNLLTTVISVGIEASGGDFQILRNTVIGFGPLVSDRGLFLTPASTGLADNNAISSFACGIEDNSAIVIGGGNAFFNNTIATC